MKRNKKNKPLVVQQREIKINPPNNVYLLKNNMIKVNKYLGDKKYECQIFENTKDMFTSPIPSSLLGIYQLSNMNFRRITLHENDLKIRAFCIYFEESYYVCQLLHCSAEKSM